MEHVDDAAPDNIEHFQCSGGRRELMPHANPGHIHFWLAPQPDPRTWSAAVGAADTCNLYTIRAFFGDPDATLPYWMKGQKKSGLQRMLRESGIDDTSGTKDVLLHRYQTGKSFVDFLIDGRECLQRMLAVALNFWGWELGHCFTATLPARGDCPWGAKRLGELDCLMFCHPTINMGSFRNNYGHRNGWWDPYHDSPEKWIKRTLQHAGPMMNRATLEDLLSHRLCLDDLAPYRTVDGVGFEPGAVGRPFDYPNSRSHDVGGALSLEQCSLCAGDRISILFDYGRCDTLVFKILQLDTDKVVLPESPVPFPTRSLIGHSGGARVRKRAYW